MKIYELKADSKLPHHYFIAVAVETMHGNNPGKIFLKYRPFYFHHSQIEKFRDAAMLTQDKLFPTTSSEALKMHNLSKIAQEFSMFKLSARSNLCSLHHFSSEFEIDEEWFSTFVESANISKSTKEKLFNAKIKY